MVPLNLSLDSILSGRLKANPAGQVSGYPVTGCRSISPLLDSKYQVPMSFAWPVA